MRGISLIPHATLTVVVPLLLFLVSVVSLDCDIVLKRHKTIPGIGVFANRDFEKSEVVERVISFMLHFNVVAGTILDKYVFGSPYQGVSTMMLGYAQMYNHLPEEMATVKFFPPRKEVPRSMRANNVTDDVAVVARYDIIKGQEIFDTYGNEKWFSDRNITLIPPSTDLLSNKLDNSSYFTLPGCPTMLTEVIHHRVYSKQFLPEGTVIEVARAIKVPPLFTLNSTLSQYAWYSAEAPELGFILLGNGALYRSLEQRCGSDGDGEGISSCTNPEKNGDDANENDSYDGYYNVRYAWYTTPRDDNQGESISAAASAPVHSTSMDAVSWKQLEMEEVALVALTASRNIYVNEELVVPLRINPTNGRRIALPSMLPFYPPTGSSATISDEL